MTYRTKGFVLPLVALAVVAASPADPARVTIASGPVEGRVEGTVVAFRGIPYARPPVGELRWRAPQPVTPWTTTRQARDFAASCMQLPFKGDEPLLTAPSEDCLYLNVWKPAATAAKPSRCWSGSTAAA